MPRPLGHLRIMMSSRVLFDLEEADGIFKEKGPGAYADYMRGRGEYSGAFDPALKGRALKKGPLYDFAKALLDLNEVNEKPIVELGFFCKDDQETALPIFRNLDVGDMGVLVEYRVATAGNPLAQEIHDAFSTDLLLTRNPQDAQTAIDNGIAAAVINFPPHGTYDHNGKSHPVRLFVDCDAVVFGGSSEVRYRTQGLEIYRDLEGKEFDQLLEPGPFTAVLAKMSQLNSEFPKGQSPFTITALTARGGIAAARVMTIAEGLGIRFNGGIFFMGGASKSEVIKAQRPHLYLDDQDVHLDAAKPYCPTGLVAYPAGSAMHRLLEEQKVKMSAQSTISAAGKRAQEISENGADMTSPPDGPTERREPEAVFAPGPKPPEPKP